MADQHNLITGHTDASGTKRAACWRIISLVPRDQLVLATHMRWHQFTIPGRTPPRHAAPPR